MTIFPVKQQRGVGLIEILVTLLILSTSLLAMGALQSRSLQFNHSAYLRSQANIMAYDILDRMRINRDNVIDYQIDFGQAPSGSGLVKTDLEEWLEFVAETLPGGEGAISCGAQVCSVSLRWAENDVPGADAPDTVTFTYTTSI
jgi:type IV pilus assembly protein PilV